LEPYLLDKATNGEGIEVLELGHAIGAEFMTAYAMGIQSSLRLIGDEFLSERKTYLYNSKLKIRELKGNEAAARALETQCLSLCDAAESFLANLISGTVTAPVVYNRLRDALLKSPNPPNDLSKTLASELLDSIEAAREGIGIALTYTLWSLSTHPQIQSLLELTLNSTSPPFDREWLGTLFPILDQMPLLDAIIIETLRLYDPAPGSQRRVVPPGGCIIEGFYLPGGTTVSSMSHCLHRNPVAFPDAESWRPERWITAEEAAILGLEVDAGLLAARDEAKRWFWAFGNGGRMCIGSHFVILGKCLWIPKGWILMDEVMKVVLAAIYCRFRTSVIDDSGMEQRDGFLASPVGDKLILRFEEI
jgi:Cytochrome P450